MLLRRIHEAERERDAAIERLNAAQGVVDAARAFTYWMYDGKAPEPNITPAQMMPPTGYPPASRLYFALCDALDAAQEREA